MLHKLPVRSNLLYFGPILYVESILINFDKPSLISYSKTIKLWVLSKRVMLFKICLLYIHGGGFSCSIVTQEGGDLSLIEVQTQSIDRHLVSLTVHLLQISDGHT